MSRIIITRGATRDNRANLPRSFLNDVEATYGGTRLGRQELDGVLFDDVEGSLWTREMIEKSRVGEVAPIANFSVRPEPVEGRGNRRRLSVDGRPSTGSGRTGSGGCHPPSFTRIVIGVDPPASASKSSDACGIIVAAAGADKRYYVLEDASLETASPEQWARRVAEVFARWNADRVVAETNQGGAMVVRVLQGGGRKLPVRPVHASRGKSVRAEPVAAAYERGEVSHCGGFAELEDEMCGMMLDGSYNGPGRSPDRADALVYALNELMAGGKPEPRVIGL